MAAIFIAYQEQLLQNNAVDFPPSYIHQADSDGDLQFFPGAVVMILIATLTASLVTNSGRLAWFSGCCC